jgi:hypothetical protein
MEASKLTVGDKTFDLNHLGKKKKTNLRRKLVIEYIQGKPAGVISEYDGHVPTTTQLSVRYAWSNRKLLSQHLKHYQKPPQANLSLTSTHL